ncbi:hypothetical protein CC86DRAFT_456837 [Ophiobolus disseminans]|uniref:Uncharacterized protein n=1 Tax=Ophiobolus disseminans TaxID=1469910 RepID=A0A6A6ZWK1_9PLEO|nr:hypothetical protein CC86DRAFT_456837 [Ophiobolus disseminans]
MANNHLLKAHQGKTWMNPQNDEHKQREQESKARNHEQRHSPYHADDSVSKTSSTRLQSSGDNVAKTTSAYPSPPSSKGSPPTLKRPIALVAQPEEQAAKKQHPTPFTPRERTQIPAAVVRNIFAETYAPTLPNTDFKHSYAPYDDDSVLVLHSAEIQRHSSDAALLNRPTVQLKVEALMLLERGLKAHDMGRSKDVRRTGPTRIIGDCDLYLRNNQIHVATESGLLLAADYLKLAGIPETAKVRFNGVKPAWMKAFLAQRIVRRINYTTEDEEPEEVVCYPPIRDGFIGLKIGYWVEVFGRQTVDGCEYAYGRNLNTKKIGWFEYAHTAAIDAEYPKWDTLYSPEQKADVIQWLAAKKAAEAKAKLTPPTTTPPAATHSTTTLSTTTPSTTTPSSPAVAKKIAKEIGTSAKTAVNGLKEQATAPIATPVKAQKLPEIEASTAAVEHPAEPMAAPAPASPLIPEQKASTPPVKPKSSPPVRSYFDEDEVDWDDTPL